MTKALFTVSALLLLSGLLCVVLAAILFKEQEPSQDVYGTDPVMKQSHWTILWAGTIQFGFGLILSAIAGVLYALEKLA